MGSSYRDEAAVADWAGSAGVPGRCGFRRGAGRSVGRSLGDGHPCRPANARSGPRAPDGLPCKRRARRRAAAPSAWRISGEFLQRPAAVGYRLCMPDLGRVEPRPSARDRDEDSNAAQIAASIAPKSGRGQIPVRADRPGRSRVGKTGPRRRENGPGAPRGRGSRGRGPAFPASRMAHRTVPTSGKPPALSRRPERRGGRFLAQDNQIVLCE